MPTFPLPSVTAGASGKVVLPIIPQGSWHWIVSQITTKAPNAPIGATCQIFYGGSIVVPFMVATGDVASGLPYLDIPPGGIATIEWTGLTPGIVCSATIIYEQAKPSGF